ncbi:MAG: DASH family cryptochrome [Bacteroidota bacterium]
MPTRSIFWFRNDLRITDNEAFVRATDAAQEVIPVFCFDPRWFKKMSLGFPKTDAYRFRFMLESVRDLAEELEGLGGELIIRVGKPEELLPNLAKEYEVESVFASQEITSEETGVERRLAQNLKPLGAKLNLYWQSTLVHLDDLPFEIEDLPDVFTHFRKKVEKGGLEVRELFTAPESIQTPEGIPSDPMPSEATFGLEARQVDDRTAITFKGGAKAAWKRVDHYFWDTDCLKEYKETRNGLLGADYSSKFSPWLAHGCFSPRQLWYEIQDYEADRYKNKSTYWMIFELLWRDYFKFVALKFGNKIFQWKGIRDEELRLRDDEKLFWKWVNGETGNPFVDANMRELKATGFMSNRGRQNVASFLVKDLKVNWQWGAEYFESVLVDYDPASNWGNWCYVAGIGNDPRNDRYFNTRVQAERYDSKGKYIKHWIPELSPISERKIHWPASLHASEQEKVGVKLGADYPFPVVEVRAPKAR